MDLRKGLLSLLVVPLSLAGAAGSAHAAGYALFTQGASALGQGNAVTAHNDSPNAIFYNPALISKLGGTQLDIGTTLVYASHEYESAAAPGLYNSSNSNVFFPSTFYITHKFNDSWSAGFGVFNPFGLGTFWGETWEGRYTATKSELTTFNFNPVVAYQIIPAVSVAAGIDVIYLDATLQNKVRTASAYDVNQRFTGDGTGVGVNLAAAWQFSDWISIGASYRSPVEVDIDGKVSTTLGPLFDSSGSTSVRLPPQFTAAVAFQVNPELTVEGGIRWEGWSTFHDLKLKLNNGTYVPPTIRDWHDTLGVNFGAKYRMSDTMSVKGGYIFGENAAPNHTFDASIPDSNTHIFCLGTDLYFNPIRVDLAYAYQYYEDRHKFNAIGAPAPANGKYMSDAHLFALNLGYRF